MGAREPRHVVMLGTDPATRGGISAVVTSWRAGGLFERWPIEYVATHRDGTRRDKLRAAAHGFLAWLSIAWRHGPGVLHVHAASRWSFWRKSVYIAAALAAGWRIVFHLHGGGFARFQREECGPIGRRAMRWVLDHASVIVVVSERWAAWMHRVTSNPRIVCIPNPVALSAAAAGEREPSLIAFAGRCEPSKGVFELLEAVAALRSMHPRLRVECAGDGDLARLERRAASLGLAGRVRLRGWIGARERAALLARCTLFTLPSHAEGLPISLLEAMAAGCPVVATAVGGIPDLVRHGANGLLVPPGDARALAAALDRLLADRQLAARLGREARATIAARYTVERSVERLEQIYRALGVPRAAVRAPMPVGKLQESS